MNGQHDLTVGPRELRHMRGVSLQLATRIRCDERSENPPVSVAFLIGGEWTQEIDWWRACQELSFAPEPIASLLTPAARSELEERGWELLSRLGYIPNAWQGTSADAAA